jgi:hypothetical protein
MKKANDMATYFSYGKRHANLMDTGKVLRGIPHIRLQVPLNGTRVVAQHSLLYNEMRLNKALKM